MKIRVRLSRLRTDTQVQNTKTMKKRGKYKCTCHVYGQIHKYKIIVSKGNSLDLSQQQKRKRRASVKTLQPKSKQAVNEGRYECTCHVCGQTHKYRNNKTEQKGNEGSLLSTSAPVTSVDRHTSTTLTNRKNLSTEPKQAITIKYECTCHVCGQTHTYKPLSS